MVLSHLTQYSGAGCFAQWDKLPISISVKVPTVNRPFHLFTPNMGHTPLPRSPKYFYRGLELRFELAGLVWGFAFSSFMVLLIVFVVILVVAVVAAISHAIFSGHVQNAAQDAGVGLG